MSLQYRLENFEGPLDLLLSLVTSAKIEIKDIFISEITEQYLSLMDQAESLDMDTASEFLQLASDLLYIKSRSLLPKKVPEDDLDEEGLTPEERLTKRLEEYRVYKEVSEKLRDFEKQGLLYRYKLPEEILPDPDQEPEFFVDAQLIMNAYQKILKKLQNKQPPPDFVTIVQDHFTPEQQIKRIHAFLKVTNRLRFEEFLSDQPSAEELVVTFSAMLELLHTGFIHAVQEENFGDIYIERRTNHA